MQPIANILFDFGNVILDIDIDGASDRLHALMRAGVSKQKASKVIKDAIFKYEANALSTVEFIGAIKSFARDDVTADEIKDAWNSMLVGIPAFRLSMLEQLKENFTLLMLSNTSALHIEWVHSHLLEMHGVDNFEKRYFHDVYYSFKIEKRKPDASAFQHVIDDAMITPKKTLFIDDIEENLKAARKLGFQTLLSPEDEEIAERLKLDGYY